MHQAGNRLMISIALLCSYNSICMCVSRKEAIVAEAIEVAYKLQPGHSYFYRVPKLRLDSSGILRYEHGTPSSDAFNHPTTTKYLSPSTKDTSLVDDKESNSTHEYVIETGGCENGQVLHVINDTSGVIAFVNTAGQHFKCLGLITVPDGFFIQMEIEDIPNVSSCNHLVVSIDDDNRFTYGSLRCYNGKFSMAFSDSSQSHFRVNVREHLEVLAQQVLYSRIHFKAVLHRGRRDLPVVFTTALSGYVTAGVIGGRPYYNRMDGVVGFVPPEGYKVLLSFPVLEIGPDNKCIYACPGQTTDCAYLKVGFITPHIKYVNTVQLDSLCPQRARHKLFSSEYGFLIWFHTHPYEPNERTNLGFKMVFSFYKGPTVRNKIPIDCHEEGVYEYIKPNIRCNLQVECRDGEDERDCPYAHPGCSGAPGAQDVCLSLVTEPSPVDWSEARKTCQARGGDLASLTTVHKWAAARSVFDHGQRRFPCFVGITYKEVSAMSNAHRFTLHWLDQTAALGNHLNMAYSSLEGNNTCGCIAPKKMKIKYCPCQGTDHETGIYDFLCQYKFQPHTPGLGKRVTAPPVLALPNATTTTTFSKPMVSCSRGHVTHAFLFCDTGSACDGAAPQSPGLCKVPRGGVTRMFSCDSNEQNVHFTLLCDFRADCKDGSDEDFCRHRPCLERTCLNAQCVPWSWWCDVTVHCLDGTDEVRCVYPTVGTIGDGALPPPAVVRIGDDGRVSYHPVNHEGGRTCPDTHFLCSGGYCLPVFLRCNTVYECPLHEDELNCHEFRCPGFYRCRSSRICLHPSHVCDGVFHCPLKDDEWQCSDDPQCPPACQCQGLAFVCRQPFPAAGNPNLRHLDGSQSGMSLPDFHSHFYLVELDLVRCRLRNVSAVSLPNLRALNLGENLLTNLDLNIFIGMENLRQLLLAGNPLVSLVASRTEIVHESLRLVDVSRTELQVLNVEVFVSYPPLSVLNVSYSPVHTIGNGGLKAATLLRVLDLTKCPVENYPRDVFEGLVQLETILTENYALCCQEVLPQNFNTSACFAPRSEVSSCEDLLRSNSYRVCLWVFASLSILGNLGCFVARLLSWKSSSKLSFIVFVMNLSVADLCMGVFLAVVGTADEWYRGQYLWHRQQWTRSAACKVAGFLALLSSEVSALIICLITLDRLLVLRFPFSRVHFGIKSSLIVSALAWTVGVSLAALPLLPGLSDWEFYGQTGICIPLPITRLSFGGRNFSFGVMIVLNFLLFVLVASGQAVIYASIRSNTIMSSDSTTQKSRDATIARRLVTVAVSDFLCWFPIGLLGMLSYGGGTPIPGEVNVGMAIFVLPLNAALNPFLYTFSMLLERLRTASERRLLTWLEDNRSAARGGATADANDAGANHAGANHAGANHAGANHAGANHAGANHAGANDAGANHAGANDAGANHAGANDAGANHAGANHAGANHAGANHAGANHAGANHAGANDAGANHAGANDAGAAPGDASALEALSYLKVKVAENEITVADMLNVFRTAEHSVQASSDMDDGSLQEVQ